MKEEKTKVEQALKSQPALQANVEQVFEKQKEFLDLQKQKATSDLRVKKAFGLSAVTSGIGAITNLAKAAIASSLNTSALCTGKVGSTLCGATQAVLASNAGTWAIYAGGAGALLSTAIWLYRTGYQASDTSIKTKAQSLNESIQTAKESMRAVQETGTKWIAMGNF